MASMVLVFLSLLCLLEISEYEVHREVLVSDYDVSLDALYMSPRSKVTDCAQDFVGSQCWMYCMSMGSQHANFKHLLSLLLLSDCFIPSKNSWSKITMSGDSKNCMKHCLNTRMLKCIITLMLLMSGNVQPNPGPVTDMISLQTPADFLNRSGIGCVHINVRSLLPKIDMVRIWAKLTNVDIMVLSETWLGSSTPDRIGGGIIYFVLIAVLKVEEW